MNATMKAFNRHVGYTHMNIIYVENGNLLFYIKHKTTESMEKNKIQGSLNG